MNNVCALRHRKIRRRVPGRPLVLEKATLILEGQTITYTLKRSRNARLIWLNYKAAEGLQVTVPEHYSLKDLPDFLKRNSQWILRQKSKREAELQLVLSLPQHPDSVLFLGKPLLLERNSGHSRNAVRLGPSGGLVIETVTGEEDENLLLYGWMKKQAGRHISRKVEHYARQIGVKYNRIGIRNQKARWGSCSRLKNLSFNWRLIMAPEAVLNYVVIHELCHLKMMNHSRDFWKLVEKYCPDWKPLKNWLNTHRLELHSMVKID